MKLIIFCRNLFTVFETFGWEVCTFSSKWYQIVKKSTFCKFKTRTNMFISKLIQKMVPPTPTPLHSKFTTPPLIYPATYYPHHLPYPKPPPTLPPPTLPPPTLPPPPHLHPPRPHAIYTPHAPTPSTPLPPRQVSKPPTSPKPPTPHHSQTPRHSPRLTPLLGYISSQVICNSPPPYGGGGLNKGGRGAVGVKRIVGE